MWKWNYSRKDIIFNHVLYVYNCIIAKTVKEERKKEGNRNMNSYSCWNIEHIHIYMFNAIYYIVENRFGESKIMSMYVCVCKTSNKTK